MKRFCFIILVIAFAVSAEAADVGVSITVGHPNFYGHIDIGDFPQPQLIFPQPVAVVPTPRGAAPQPLYLRVPPGHEKNWKKHCRKYNACDHPVYFVRNQWYQDVYVPEYQARHGRGGSGRDGDKQSDKGNRGKGKGHGNKRDRD